MSPANNNEKQNEEMMQSIINDTKKEFVRGKCKGIGKVWKKNCPKCGKEQHYSSMGNFERAIKIRSLCKTCNVICNKSKSQYDFINQCARFHNNVYDYSKTKYKKAHSKIIVICPKHGNFKLRANNHLLGIGCPECRNERLHERFKYDEKKFIKISSESHNNYYDYSKVIYYNDSTKVKIICPLHGKFLQSPNKHKSGQGCPKCFYQVSKKETEFFDYIGLVNRSFRLPKWKQKSVDGYDPTTNTVYEFLGDYWHGNPEIYKQDDIHPEIKIKYGDINTKTFNNLYKIKLMGYNVKYIWENDWDRLKEGKTKNLIIRDL